MARKINRLSPRQVSTVVLPGYYADGLGLYLQIARNGSKSWVYRFTLDGKKREMGLGPVYDVGLADARIAASACRALVREGIDPIDQRKRRRAIARTDNEVLMTFKECALAFIRLNQAQWSNLKHAKQWTSTLTHYAFPIFGDVPIDIVSTDHVLKALEPIWAEKTETATRVRQRIEAVLDAAKVQGLRNGENPARWKGHLDKLLPKPGKVKKSKHHNALPFEETAAFNAALREREAVSARGLEFLLLTAARTGEVIGATFDEIDFENGTWTIPAERMKASKKHVVPLSKRALEIAASMRDLHGGPNIFPGDRRPHLSNMAFLQLLKRMDRADLTAHGFRSTFRDWAAERTAYPGEVIEMALAHSIVSKTEAAYRRGDLLEKRRRLMDDWAGYCNQPANEGAAVVSINDAR